MILGDADKRIVLGDVDKRTVVGDAMLDSAERCSVMLAGDSLGVLQMVNKLNRDKVPKHLSPVCVLGGYDIPCVLGAMA